MTEEADEVDEAKEAAAEAAGPRRTIEPLIRPAVASNARTYERSIAVRLTLTTAMAAIAIAAAAQAEKLPLPINSPEASAEMRILRLLPPPEYDRPYNGTMELVSISFAGIV